jgi:hypothetical protein
MQPAADVGPWGLVVLIQAASPPPFDSVQRAARSAQHIICSAAPCWASTLRVEGTRRDVSEVHEVHEAHEGGGAACLPLRKPEPT